MIVEALYLVLKTSNRRGKNLKERQKKQRNKDKE